MNTWIKKTIIWFVVLIALVAIGLSLASKKSISVESRKLIIKSELAVPVVAATEKVEKPVKILFTGDMMFDRYIRQITAKRGADFIFAGVKGILTGNDLVVGNLEGPITDGVSVSADSEIGSHDNYIFTFDSKIGSELWNNNIHLVNIGNNHILNFGEDGLKQTKENLKQNKVDFFGDPAGEKRFAVWQKNGLKIVFVSYNQFEGSAASKTLADIKEAKTLKPDKIILYTHWGKEFVPEPADDIKNLAHEFIDSGADLIIGSHPHVVQSKELYKGKTIYYSLGNFIFDQYFSPETQRGLAVQIEIDPKSKGITFSEIPINLKNNGQSIR